MSDWVELELLPPWKPVEGYPPPAYAIVNGRVMMRGSAKGGAAGDPIAPLPEEVRPPDGERLVNDTGDECRVIDGKLVPTLILYEWGGGSRMALDYPGPPA